MKYVEQIKQENIELRNAVKRRTIELENKNRELEIEGCLERVRAVALSMQKPVDMLDVCRVISDQLELLNLKDIRNLQTAIIDDAKGIYLNYEYFTQYKRTSFLEIEIKLHPIVVEFVKEIKKSSDAFFTKTIEGKALEDWREYRRKTNQDPDPILNNSTAVHYYFYSIGPGALGISTYSPLNEKDISIFKRFHNVFNLAYRRFIDIETAEAQAREAHIESALEKIRSRTLLMKDSTELNDAVAVFFQQFKVLELLPAEARTYFSHINTSTNTVEVWMTHADGRVLSGSHFTPMTQSPQLKKYYNEWKNNKELINTRVYKGQDLINYMNFLSTLPHVAKDEDYQKIFKTPPIQIVMTDAGFLHGFLGIMSFEPLKQEAIEILSRFAKEFEFTYTRFLDLKKAEAQAREAVRQASLDRVRAEIASMRTSEDLQRITPTIWKELTTLNVPFFRCGIFIFDEDETVAHAYLSTPSGESLAVLHLDLGKGIWVDKALSHWHQDKIYYEEWDREQFKAWAEKMLKMGLIDNRKKFQAGQEAPERLSLQLLPFSQGMLYVGSVVQLSKEELELSQKLARVFGIAYSRYEDFQKLEAAKAKVETSLHELDQLSKELEVKNTALEIENDRKALELEEARQLQLAMLPKTIPSLPNLDIAVHMQTATEVGGDYYDFHTGENGTLTVALGDATGHGLKAGTMVTITKSLFNSLAGERDISDTFNKMTSVIKDMKLRQLSMCLMMLKIKDNQVSMSSAAIPPALIYRTDKKQIEEILTEGLPLGTMSHFSYKQISSTLNSGDTILLLSDGLPELQNSEGDMYGYERIKEELLSVGDNTPSKIIDHFKTSASKWANGNDPDDDVTFVVIKVK